MDLTAIRRSLLMGIGGSAMLGELTKYEKKTLTFSDAKNTNNWNDGAIIPCSFEPKMIKFYGGTDVDGNIIEGGFVFGLTGGGSSNNGGGFATYRNLANHTIGQGAIGAYNFDGNQKTAAAARLQYYDNKIWVTRVSGNGYWSNTDSYTFEIYG